MEVYRFTSYKFNGKDLHSLNQVEMHIDNMLGEFLDRACNSGIFSPQHRIQLFEFIKSFRYELSDILHSYSSLDDAKAEDEEE